MTNNKRHPALKVNYPNVTTIFYRGAIDLKDMMRKLRNEYGIRRLTIQTGGTLNAEFIRAGLVDHISLVVAPVMIGGKDTATIMDGSSLGIVPELAKLQALQLKFVRKLKDSYLHLGYDTLPRQNR